jgi:hypothetical protein
MLAKSFQAEIHINFPQFFRSPCFTPWALSSRSPLPIQRQSIATVAAGCRMHGAGPIWSLCIPRGIRGTPGGAPGLQHGAAPACCLPVVCHPAPPHCIARGRRGLPPSPAPCAGAGWRRTRARRRPWGRSWPMPCCTPPCTRALRSSPPVPQGRHHPPPPLWLHVPHPLPRSAGCGPSHRDPPGGPSQPSPAQGCQGFA